MASQPAARSNAPVLVGLLMGVLLAALDQTVVATSAFTIMGDLGGFDRFTWLFAAYMLASTIVIPVAGKFSDIYGRRPVYLVGMAVFLLGSALCGTATSMTQLILYRGLQGLGGGMIFPVAIATIADLYAPAERGRVGGLFGAVFGLSSVAGPFVGGWIVDYMHVADIASWRWVFYVNVPIGAVAIAMVAMYFPRLQNRSTLPIDWLGIFTLTGALLAGLLVTIWGGETYAWSSPQILGLGLLALAGVAAFVLIERRAADPVIPLELFRNDIFRVSALASVLMGAAMFAVVTFMPNYLQGVVGISATYSGTSLIPLSLGLVGGSIVSGILMKRFGYKVFAVGGPIIALVGYGLLALLPLRPSVVLVIAEMAFLGIGVGFTIQTFLIATQNAVSRRLVGAATSSITLFRTLGATFGITALGVVLNRRLQGELTPRVPPETLRELLANPLVAGKVEGIPTLLRDPRFVESAPPALVEAIKDGFALGLSTIWTLGAAVAAAALLVTIFLRNIPVKGAAEYEASNAEAAAAPAGHL